MQKADLQRLAEIYVDVYTAFDVGERWTTATAKQLLSYWLDKQPDLAFVAAYENKIVGAFLSGIKPWWDGNHLFDGELFVHPDYQKKGIGTELSKALYQKAVETYNVTHFDAHTFRKTEFPLKWYKAQGFMVNEDWVMISGDVKKVMGKLRKHHFSSLS